MQTPLVLLAALTLGLARADYLDREDVPSQCQDICRPVVEISDSCDAQHDDDDQELSCICNANNMSTQIPECELCIRPFHQQDDDDDFDGKLLLGIRVRDEDSGFCETDCENSNFGSFE